jgi:hypothetical protein
MLQCSATTAKGSRCKNIAVRGGKYCYIHHGQKRPTRWYKNPATLLTVISVLLSTIVGIAAILNSNSIARLDREVYVPNLIYRVGQNSIGNVYFEATNQGAIVAQQITVSINWAGYAIDLQKCTPSPPYQDIQLVQPVVEHNFTYRLLSLPNGAAFRVACEISASTSISSVDPDSIPFTLGDLLDINNIPMPSALPGNIPISTAPPSFTPVPGIVGSTSVRYVEIMLSRDLVDMNVTAENAKPATEVGQRTRVVAKVGVFPIIVIVETPTPTP